MSVGGTSGCCSSALPQGPEVVGGGAGSVQQVPVQPVVAAQPATGYDPNPQVSGGGSAGGCNPCSPAQVYAGGQLAAGTPVATTAVPDAVDPNTGQPLANQPAPGAQPGAATATAPDPIAAPDTAAAQPGPATVPTTEGSTTASAPVVTGGGAIAESPAQQAPVAASLLPTWANWEQELRKLGLGDADIAKVAAKPLTDQQLAVYYTTIREEVAAQGPASTTNAWSPEWEQRFAALVPPAAVAELRELAKQRGATDAQLRATYDDIVAQKAADSQGAAGWSPEWEKKFGELGMPTEQREQFSKSGAPAAGLQSEYDRLAGRMQQLRDTGFVDKLKANGAKDEEIWGLANADKQPTTDELRKMNDALSVGNNSMLEKASQTTLSLLPGGFLAQYLAGRRVFGSGVVGPVTGGGESITIDRTNPMNIGMAALSGVALLASVRHGAKLKGAWKAISGGMAETQKAGLVTAGQGVAELGNGAFLKLQNGGFAAKLKSAIPFTEAHRQAIGFGHLENAASAWNNGVRVNVLRQADGMLQAATLGQMFDDVKRGATVLEGGKNGWAPMFKRLVPFTAAKNPFTVAEGQQLKPVQAMVDGVMTATPGGLGPDTLTIAKNVRTGEEVLNGMLRVGGDRISATRGDWLQGAKEALGNVDDMADNALLHLGPSMEANFARHLRETAGTGVRGPVSQVIGRVFAGPAEYYGNLAKRPMASGHYDVFSAGVAKGIFGDEQLWGRMMAAKKTEDIARLATAADEGFAKVPGQLAKAVAAGVPADDAAALSKWFAGNPNANQLRLQQIEGSMGTAATAAATGRTATVADDAARVVDAGSTAAPVAGGARASNDVAAAKPVKGRKPRAPRVAKAPASVQPAESQAAPSAKRTRSGAASSHVDLATVLEASRRIEAANPLAARLGNTGPTKEQIDAALRAGRGR